MLAICYAYLGLFVVALFYSIIDINIKIKSQLVAELFAILREKTKSEKCI